MIMKTLRTLRHLCFRTVSRHVRLISQFVAAITFGMWMPAVLSADPITPISPYSGELWTLELIQRDNCLSMRESSKSAAQADVQFEETTISFKSILYIDEKESDDNSLVQYSGVNEADCGPVLSSRYLDLSVMLNREYTKALQRGESDEQAQAYAFDWIRDSVSKTLSEAVAKAADLEDAPGFLFRSFVTSAADALSQPAAGGGGQVNTVIGGGDTACPPNSGRRPRGNSWGAKLRMVAFLACCWWNGSKPPDIKPRPEPEFPKPKATVSVPYQMY